MNSYIIILYHSLWSQETDEKIIELLGNIFLPNNYCPPPAKDMFAGMYMFEIDDDDNNNNKKTTINYNLLLLLYSNS